MISPPQRTSRACRPRTAVRRHSRASAHSAARRTYAGRKPRHRLFCPARLLQVTESEASTEFGRLKAKYSSIIGTLPSAINPATVGGSTRYRLAVGPVASRDQATKICSSLVAAGERDCLVRKQ